MNQQQQNHHLRTDSNLSHWGRLKCILVVSIFALDSADVEAQKMLSSHGGYLTITIYHHRETI